MRCSLRARLGRARFKNFLGRKFLAFARCAAGALGLAAFFGDCANAHVRKEPPKRSCAPDAARSPPRHARARRLQRTPPPTHCPSFVPRPGAIVVWSPGVGKIARFDVLVLAIAVVLATAIEPRDSSPQRGYCVRSHLASKRGRRCGVGGRRLAVVEPLCDRMERRRGGSTHGPPRCIPAQPFLQTIRPVASDERTPTIAVRQLSTRALP